jgi:hypothetical protein
MKTFLSLLILMGIIFIGLNCSQADAQTQTPDTLATYIALKNGNFLHSGEYVEFTGNVVDITTQKPVSGATVNLVLSEPNGTTTKIANVTSVSNGGEYDFILPITNGFGIGEYVVNPYAQKEGYATGMDDNSALFFLVARENKQIIKAEGQDFPAYFESMELQTNNLTFNQDTKSLNFGFEKITGDYMPKGISWVDPSSPPSYASDIFVTFKRPLISAPFHVFVNNHEVDAKVSENQTYYFLDMTLSDSDSNGTGNVSVVGTYVIPEFPLAIPMLFIGFISLLALYRIKISK